MKKLILVLLSGCFILFVNGQPLPSAKAVEVINYKEVLSQIEYPKEAKEKGIEGKVIISLKVDANGSLIDYEFISYPCNDLKAEVSKALSKLKFNPALNAHGEAVVSKIHLPINFELTI